MVKPTFNAGDKLVFIGDSITDSGRRDAAPPLGNGYVAFFKDIVDSQHPELMLNVINKGISGNTIRDLKERWEDDVISLKPRLVSVLIGINDAHRFLGGDLGLSPDDYYKMYSEVLDLTIKRINPVILLIAPFYVSKANELDTFRRKVLQLVSEYVKRVERLSAEYSTLFINLHEEFQARLSYIEPEALAPDAVHPTRKGHMLIALKIYDKLLS
ncbi:SGNH/GDSL hydrolase family protein [Caldivirga maquilingensis]|uniref:Lipolytic protein G-D-S-L family n=1 Tax=Caldivirga maquilingensis (strain ATCC 700844 / DSM 13496 / JCM 10307 / IC-167) TaxID=397948 RepID=A8MBU5_CALMQ|nr:SGNH/GDSL hydrolase family protein [Caldivirga maquilingensis]ABW01288.1 lipolytic protein G-D-S-L family [Caldivirga maquilingensis IC-167]